MPIPASASASSSSTLEGLVQNARVTVRRDGPPDPNGTCVVYWMQRSQRGIDNHALNVAVTLANELDLPLVVYFAGIANFPHANLRHYVFLQQGLVDVEADLRARNIAFVMRRAPHESHLKLFADVHPAIVVGDESPMREPERWRAEIASKLTVPFWTVDADVVVPSKLMERAQYAAYTMRPKLTKLLPQYLVPYENPHAKHLWHAPKGFHQDSVHDDITAGWKNFDRSVQPVTTFHGGTHAAQARLKIFVEQILPRYDMNRNKPEIDSTSALSPYLHYGHLGAQTIALAVDAAARKHPAIQAARDSFLDELITWRELSINFVKYQPDYDAATCAEDWAKKTIAEHAADARDPLYTTEQMERAETYDELWNAAQIQMVETGWMHNHLRMYWGKKILEWTPDAATALETTIYLNDRYFLCGRDPNGYAGAAWAILGKFDRPWNERPIFGKIRYMSGASTGRKFDSKLYIKQMYALRAGKSAATVASVASV